MRRFTIYVCAAVLIITCGHRMKAVGPGGHLLHRRAGGERGAVPARQRGLAVLCVNLIRNHPALGTIELGAGDAFFDDLRQDGVNGVFKLR